MPIHKIIPLNTTATELWAIVGKPDRVDWVPGVTGCEYDGDVRSFSLPGAGAIKERILSLDAQNMRIEYTCFESPTPLEKHLASIEVKTSGDTCEMHWKTDVQPEAFEPFIEQSMDGSIDQIKAILKL